MSQYNLSIQDTLLKSALLCGVTPDKPRVHRLQLFFCANFVVRKDSSEEDFQRYIETEVDKQDNTNYWLRAGRGLYKLTAAGYQQAKHLFPTTSPRFSPADKISEVHYKLTGHYGSHSMALERQGTRFEATIDGKPYTNIQNACSVLGFKTVDRSAPRILYNLAVKNNFAAA